MSRQPEKDNVEGNLQPPNVTRYRQQQGRCLPHHLPKTMDNALFPSSEDETIKFSTNAADIDIAPLDDPLSSSGHLRSIDQGGILQLNKRIEDSDETPITVERLAPPKRLQEYINFSQVGIVQPSLGNPLKSSPPNRKGDGRSQVDDFVEGKTTIPRSAGSSQEAECGTSILQLVPSSPQNSSPSTEERQNQNFKATSKSLKSMVDESTTSPKTTARAILSMVAASAIVAPMSTSSSSDDTATLSLGMSGAAVPTTSSSSEMISNPSSGATTVSSADPPGPSSSISGSSSTASTSALPAALDMVGWAPVLEASSLATTPPSPPVSTSLQGPCFLDSVSVLMDDDGEDTKLNVELKHGGSTVSPAHSSRKDSKNITSDSAACLQISPQHPPSLSATLGTSREETLSLAYSDTSKGDTLSNLDAQNLSLLQSKSSQGSAEHPVVGGTISSKKKDGDNSSARTDRSTRSISAFSVSGGKQADTVERPFLLYVALRQPHQRRNSYDGAMVDMVEKMHGSGQTLDYRESLQITIHSQHRYLMKLQNNDGKERAGKDVECHSHGDDCVSSASSSSGHSFAVEESTVSDVSLSSFSASVVFDKRIEKTVRRQSMGSPRTTKYDRPIESLAARKMILGNESPASVISNGANSSRQRVAASLGQAPLHRASHSSSPVAKRKLTMKVMERMQSSAPEKLNHPSRASRKNVTPWPRKAESSPHTTFLPRSRIQTTKVVDRVVKERTSESVFATTPPGPQHTSPSRPTSRSRGTFLAGNGEIWVNSDSRTLKASNRTIMDARARPSLPAIAKSPTSPYGYYSPWRKARRKFTLDGATSPSPGSSVSSSSIDMDQIRKKVSAADFASAKRTILSNKQKYQTLSRGGTSTSVYSSTVYAAGNSSWLQSRRVVGSLNSVAELHERESDSTVGGHSTSTEWSHELTPIKLVRSAAPFLLHAGTSLSHKVVGGGAPTDKQTEAPYSSGFNESHPRPDISHAKHTRAFASEGRHSDVSKPPTTKGTTPSGPALVNPRHYLDAFIPPPPFSRPNSFWKTLRGDKERQSRLKRRIRASRRYASST